jgi:DNA-binding transcriptional regulator LsrR (DeoR family)
MRHRDRPSRPTIVLELTQTDIAALTGLSRQTVNAELHRLEERGLVELAFRQIRIADVERLRAELGTTQDERREGLSAACR